ncbi:MAG: hypothetical protein AAGG75_10335 [Bacteroidota bacterium]
MYSNKARFRGKPWPVKLLFFLLAAAAFLLLVGGAIMWLWNAILPDLVGVKPIRFWQAVGLLLLVRLLMGGLRYGLFGSKRHYARKRRWKEKWMNMSEEERQEFKNRWKERCRHRSREK